MNELKNMIKTRMDPKEREKFTFNDLTELISEINQEREKEMQKVTFRRAKSTRNIEGEER